MPYPHGIIRMKNLLFIDGRAMMQMVKFWLGVLRSLTKDLNYWIKEINVTFKSLDDIIKNTNTLALKYGKEKDKHLMVIPQSVMMTLENPLMRFSCMPEMKMFLAKSVAESIYALSGMNGSDFIRDFRGWGDSRMIAHVDTESIGQPLRFWGEKTGNILDYANSNYLRQQGTGFMDQFQKAFVHLINSDDGFVISMREPNRDGGRVHSIWIQKDDSGRLQMMVTCGEIEVTKELTIKIIPSFGFIHQMLSEVTNIPLGTLTIVIAKLYGYPETMNLVKEISKAELPLVGGLNDFAYPASNLTLRDVDTLIAMMQEFVGRLDEKSLLRANPYEGDSRVQHWSDMAEVFRANKAEELGYRIESESVFVHPQLQYIYKGVTI
jgi:hypothetical protein